MNMVLVILIKNRRITILNLITLLSIWPTYMATLRIPLQNNKFLEKKHHTYYCIEINFRR